MYYICLVLTLLTPLAMIILGLKWYLRPPAFGARGLAYRTAITEKSPEAWEFAHTHCGKLWVRYGVIGGAISAAGMIFLKNYYQNFWLWLIGAQMLLLCITIIMIDYLTKNLFDENGERVELPGKKSE